MSNHSGHFRSFSGIGEVSQPVVFRKDWLETCIRVNSDELSALADNYEPFEDGKEFTNPAHRYSFDLDLFGRHSLFQALNRTCTSFGKEKLAEWLQNHLEIKEEIIQRQEATKELAAYSDFRETFRITGLLYKGATSDREEIKEWTEAPAYFSKKVVEPPVIGNRSRSQHRTGYAGSGGGHSDDMVRTGLRTVRDR